MDDFLKSSVGNLCGYLHAKKINNFYKSVNPKLQGWHLIQFTAAVCYNRIFKNCIPKPKSSSIGVSWVEKSIVTKCRLWHQRNIFTLNFATICESWARISLTWVSFFRLSYSRQCTSLLEGMKCDNTSDTRHIIETQFVT